jgi:hypothetical protein
MWYVLTILVLLILPFIIFMSALQYWHKSVAYPIIFEIVGEKSSVSLRELCNETRERVGKRLPFFVLDLSPPVVILVNELVQAGYLLETELFATMDPKRWGQYKYISLTDKGRARAR